MDDALITADELAAVLRVGVATVKTWAREGRYPAVKLPSGEWRFRRDDLTDLLGTKPPVAS